MYKLHGSINWLEWRLIEKKTGELKSITQPSVYVCNEPLPDALNENGAYLFRIMEDSGRRVKTFNPVLIPFVFQKDDWLGRQGRWKEIFREHWKDAQEYLKSSSLRIIFVGYSLPPADHHMLSWLLEILNAVEDVQVELVTNRGKDNENTPLEKALWPFIKDPAKDIFTEGLEAYLLNGMAAD